MITYHFLSELQPIETSYDQMPFMHVLDEDMDLPDTRAAFNPAANMKDLTIKDFFNAKEKALPTWKLMDFQEFMSFCRKAKRMCQSSSREGAAVNTAALGELMDVCLRTYRTMDRMNELGPGETRFKARMYLHLQYMCTHRIFHASAIAMTVFAEATDPFVARLRARPGYNGRVGYNGHRNGHAGAAAATSTTRTTSTTASSYRKTAVKNTPPVSGCYKCPATDHYANDPRFHPLKSDGSHEKLSDETKAAIFNRIDVSTLSSAAKAEEKEKVRQYWSQHKL